METQGMNHVAKHPRRFLSAFSTLLLLNFLVAVHHFSIVYVNSSFLGQFFSAEMVSAIYVAGAIFTIVMLAAAPQTAATFGPWFSFVLVVPALQLAVFFMGFSKTSAAVALFFTIQAGFIFVLRYLMDLYLESLSRDESKTGNTRGLFITAGNIGVFLGPLIASVVIVGSTFAPLYAFSALLLAPVFFIALGPLRRIMPSLPKTVRFLEGMREVRRFRPNISYVMAVNFLMRLFNIAIVIYAPLYLFEVGGFSWQAIGTLTAVALLPYIILEVPLGSLADNALGEKEIMLTGLIILSAAMILLSLTPLSLFFVWSIWFIVTRIGGAMVEIATESYFFKKVTEEDASIISAFRMLAPLSTLAAPLIALVALPFVGLQYLFAVFGAVFLLGIPFALRLVDTR